MHGQVQFMQRRRQLLRRPCIRRLAEPHSIAAWRRRRWRMSTPAVIKLFTVEKGSEAAGRDLSLQKHRHDAGEHRERKVEQLIQRECREHNVSRQWL